MERTARNWRATEMVYLPLYSPDQELSTDYLIITNTKFYRGSMLQDIELL